MDSSAPFTMMPDTNYCNIIVPTMDTMQMSYLLGMLITSHKPVSAAIMPCPSPPKAQARPWLVFYTNKMLAPCMLALGMPTFPIQSPTALPGAVCRTYRHREDAHCLQQAS